MLNYRPIAESKSQLQRLEHRKQLLDRIHAETGRIRELIHTIEQHDLINKDQCLALVAEVITATEDILKVECDDTSLFLRNIIKPIKTIHQHIVMFQENLLETHTAPIKTPPIPAGMVPVYISLFQTEGLNLVKWATQIRTLAHYSQSRPIYRHEANVLKMIRGKLDHSCDAYMVVAIDPNHILVQSNPRFDRHGSELLTLMDNSIDGEYFIEFVHQGKRYCWVDRQLILQK